MHSQYTRCSRCLDLALAEVHEAAGGYTKHPRCTDGVQTVYRRCTDGAQTVHRRSKEPEPAWCLRPLHAQQSQHRRAAPYRSASRCGVCVLCRIVCRHARGTTRAARAWTSSKEEPAVASFCRAPAFGRSTTAAAAAARVIGAAGSELGVRAAVHSPATADGR
jgi:hypothetical protein